MDQNLNEENEIFSKLLKFENLIVQPKKNEYTIMDFKNLLLRIVEEKIGINRENVIDIRKRLLYDVKQIEYIADFQTLLKKTLDEFRPSEEEKPFGDYDRNKLCQYIVDSLDIGHFIKAIYFHISTEEQLEPYELIIKHLLKVKIDKINKSIFKNIEKYIKLVKMIDEDTKLVRDQIKLDEIKKQERVKLWRLEKEKEYQSNKENISIEKEILTNLLEYEGLIIRPKKYDELTITNFKNFVYQIETKKILISRYGYEKKKDILEDLSSDVNQIVGYFKVQSECQKALEPTDTIKPSCEFAYEIKINSKSIYNYLEKYIKLMIEEEKTTTLKRKHENLDKEMEIEIEDQREKEIKNQAYEKDQEERSKDEIIKKIYRMQEFNERNNQKKKKLIKIKLFFH